MEIEALERTRLASGRRWIMGAGMWWLLHGLIFHVLFDGIYRSDLARQALYVGIGLCAVHAGLFCWSRTNPLAASMIALVLFLVLHGMMIAANPRILFPIRVSLFGLAVTVFWYAVRVLFVVKLAQGIGAAFELRRLRAQQPKLPVARVI